MVKFFQVHPIYSQQDILIKMILKLMKDFRTLHDLRPNFMKEIFYCFLNLTHRKDNLYVHTRHTHTHISFLNKLLTNCIFKYLVYIKNIWYIALCNYLIYYNIHRCWYIVNFIIIRGYQKKSWEKLSMLSTLWILF